MTEITERLKANAERMREIADAQGTVAPGSQEKRVWVPSKDLENWAQTSEDAAKEMSEARQPTAFEREHPGYFRALREAAKSHERHVQAARRVGKSATLEDMRRVHEALKLNDFGSKFLGYGPVGVRFISMDGASPCEGTSIAYCEGSTIRYFKTIEAMDKWLKETAVSRS